MTRIRVAQFSGMAPKIDPELLGNGVPQAAQNCKIQKGKLVPFKNPLSVQPVSLGGTVRTILRLGGQWLQWNGDVDVAPSPLLGENVNRIFLTSDSDIPRVTDLGLAMVGTANTLLQDDTEYSITSGKTYFNSTLVALGAAVGNTLNGYANFIDTNGVMVGGKLTITYLDAGSAVIRTDTGTIVTGASALSSSILVNSVVPAGTSSVQIVAACTSAGAGFVQNLRVTLGVIPSYPAGVFKLGLPAPTVAPVGTPVPPTGTASVATNYNVQATSTLNVPQSSTFAGNVVSAAPINVDGSRIGIFVDYMFYVSQVNLGTGKNPGGTFIGNVAFTINRGATAIFTKNIPVAAVMNPFGTAINGMYTGQFSFVDSQSPIANETYSVSAVVTWTPIGTLSPGAGLKTYFANGFGGTFISVYYNDYVDVTVNDASALSPGSKITFKGARGMTSLNGTFDIVSVTGNVVRIPLHDIQSVSTIGAAVTWSETFDASVITDKFYVYTYVSEFDGMTMEGPPSPVSAVVESGPEEVVNVTVPTTAPPGYNIVQLNVYRTLSGADGNTAYQFSGSVPLGTNPYVDSVLDANLGEVLTTPNPLPPPGGMRGLIATPNGTLIGFIGNNYLPSMSYLPSSYPEEYQQSVESDIVALAYTGASIVAMTETKPFLITGPDPSSLTPERIELSQSCVSKRGVVDMGTAIVYPSPDGLVAVGPGIANVITSSAISADDWRKLYAPSTILACRYQNWYIGFYDNTANGGVQGGFVIDINDAAGSFVPLDVYATAAWTDLATGNLYLVVGGEIVQFDADADFMDYTWQSKDFLYDHTISFGRALVRAEGYPVTLQLVVDGTPQTAVTVADSNVFTLPAGAVGRRVSFIVSGDSKVNDVVIGETAADMRTVE